MELHREKSRDISLKESQDCVSIMLGHDAGEQGWEENWDHQEYGCSVLTQEKQGPNILRRTGILSSLGPMSLSHCVGSQLPGCRALSSGLVLAIPALPVQH